MPRGRITVLRRMANHDLLEQYNHQTTAPCDRFETGQEFIIEQWDTVPNGFCEWAWADIHKKVQWAMGEGDGPEEIKQKGMIIACCTDGFKPVVFEIKKIEPST